MGRLTREYLDALRAWSARGPTHPPRSSGRCSDSIVAAQWAPGADFAAVQQRIEELVAGGVHEAFLIGALVADMEANLEEQIEDYGKGKRRFREDTERLREELRARAPSESTEAAQRRLDELQADLGTASLHEMRDRQQVLIRWREVAGRLADRDYLQDVYFAEMRG
jgi:hypothetical protein